VQAVLDAPMGPDGSGERHGVEPCRAQIVAPCRLDLAAALDPALDHADHREAGEGGFACIAPIREQPAHVVADGVRPLLDATVVAVGRGVRRDLVCGGIGEEALDVGVEQWAVLLEGQAIVAAAFENLRGDLDLGAHGIDGDERALQHEPVEQ